MGRAPGTSTRPPGIDVLLDGLGEYVEKVEQTKRSRNQGYQAAAFGFLALVAICTLVLVYLGIFSVINLAAFTMGLTLSLAIFSSLFLDLQRDYKRALIQLRRVYELASRIEDTYSNLDSPTRLLLEVKLADAGFLLGQSEHARAYIDNEVTRPRTREETPPREIEPATH